MLEKLKNKIKQVESAARKKSQELYDSIKVSSEVREQRLNTCLSCEHLFKPTNTCKKCGCFMDAKTWLAPASCPIGKWGSVDIKDVIETEELN